MAATSRRFELIDNALAQYYKRLNAHYRDSNGIGLFLNYIKNEELDDPELPIELELGDKCDPNDCAYTWMSGDMLFPVPIYAQIPHDETEVFIFYVLQYCYKYNQPPSDEYIGTVLVGKCNGTINQTVLRQCTRNNIDYAYEEGTIGTDDVIEGEAFKIQDKIPKQITRLLEEEFKPKYPPRAHLNIFTAKELTKELRDIIEQEFENDLILYYYTDISTALQMNDKQMKEFKILMNNTEKRLSVINYDLHVKGQPNEILYGIIVPNDNYNLQCDKWLWKLDEFLTAEKIYKKYKIRREELPKSSRKMVSFQRQLCQPLVIEESLIDETDWFNIQQIKSLKRNIKIPKVTIRLTKEMWILDCKKSFSNVALPLIRVIVNKNNNHWIEWIKIINIKSQNIYVGISFKYYENNNKWNVQSICLDRSDIYNKHRLVGQYKNNFNSLQTTVTEIRFIDNKPKKHPPGCYAFKRKTPGCYKYLRNQTQKVPMECVDANDKRIIVRLKESLLTAKNTSKYDVNNNITSDNNAIEEKSFEETQQLINEDIKEFIDDNKDDIIGGGECDLWLDQIVDDVIKSYDVLQLKPKPRFKDEAMMYYWLDYTTAMQMCPKYSKPFKFLFANRIEDDINWRNLKLFYSQSTNNDRVNKSITITRKVMKEYCIVALERLIAPNNENNNLIPILVIDQHNNCNIEWVLIVYIIHKNCHVGVSFKYDEESDIFVATTLYLDKYEIELKHKLIDNRFNDSGQFGVPHFGLFSLEKFQFKSRGHLIIDNDIEVQILKYKKALQQLQVQIQEARKTLAILKYKLDPLLPQQLITQQQNIMHINLVLHKKY